MNDIVIPYLRNRSAELDACLMLIHKNVLHRNVHVVEQYDRKMGHGLPHVNQILKLKWAIENLDLSEEFYLYNDDFFVMEPIENTPYYHKGALEAHIASRPNDSYTRALKATSEYLGEGALSYELHVPFLFNRDKLYALIKKLEPEIARGTCPHIRSAYGNLYGVGGTYKEDVKNPKDFEGKIYLSTTESSFKKAIGEYIWSKI